MVSKLAKALGFIGGVAAVVWTMRDRFISVAVSREPEPPSLRTRSADPIPLSIIVGIGPTYEKRLNDAGFADPSDLIEAGSSKVAEIAGVSESRAEGWIKQASTLPLR